MSKGPVMMEILRSLHWLKVILLIGIKLCPDKNDHVGLLSIITLLYYTNSLLFTCISISV
jgi:hypothetical protein